MTLLESVPTLCSLQTHPHPLALASPGTGISPKPCQQPRFSNFQHRAPPKARLSPCFSNPQCRAPPKPCSQPHFNNSWYWNLPKSADVTLLWGVPALCSPQTHAHPLALAIPTAMLSPKPSLLLHFSNSCYRDLPKIMDMTLFQQLPAPRSPQNHAHTLALAIAGTAISPKAQT